MFGKRFFLHIPVGFINIICYEVSPHYGWAFFIGFILYEIYQDMAVGDHSFKDILGALWGLGFGVCVLKVIEVLS